LVWFLVATALIIGCGGGASEGTESTGPEDGAANDEALDGGGVERDAFTEGSSGPPCVLQPDAGCPAELPAPDSPCAIEGLACTYPPPDDASTYVLARCYQTLNNGLTWLNYIDRPAPCTNDETVVELNRQPCDALPQIACDAFNLCETPQERLTQQLYALVHECIPVLDLIAPDRVRVEFSRGCAERLFYRLDESTQGDASAKIACIQSRLEASRWSCANDTVCASVEGYIVGPP
jgi:hypothetical protein